MSMPPSSSDIHILFDGPPASESGRFVEVENSKGESISVGRWEERDNSYWALVIPAPRVLDREAVLLALSRADGQFWESIAEATPHTANIMYGKQADAVLALLYPPHEKKEKK